ncbi:DMT family transporter [Donghicola sp. C2-DW-16]|uniref:DMT family transporter n=1 Tax=Donghicola mangrovi TaxID=2729614 RepID=A0ABX2PAS8_9RHOB|nr:DMT family transporter [Donghicola mangrovi]NVO26206.1 DMT family transporter [Donghicola mangrovi]
MPYETYQPFKAIALKLCSVVVFMSMAAMVKATADDVPTGEAVFFRSAFAMPVLFGWLFLRGALKTGLSVKSPLGHVLRGFIGASAMGMNFLALGLLPLPEVTAIGFVAPLLTVMFAALLLGERVGPFRITMVLLGLIGVLIVLWPRLTLETAEAGATLGAVLVLGSAVARALAQVQIRRLVEIDNPSAIVFWFTVTTTVLSLLTAPFGWVMPEPTALMLLIGAGLFGGMGQILMTSAYRFAGASLVAPFDYSSMIIALGMGYLLFAEVPTLQMLAGAAVVILAGGLLIWREHSLGLKRGKARSGMTPQG